MSDAEWAVCEPLLPHPAWLAGKGGRPSAHCMRDIVDGIRYLTHNGPVWRALPADFPPAWTVYYWAGKWQADGSTEAMHDRLREQVRQVAGRKAAPTAAIIGSQSVRAAEGVARTSRGYDAGKKVNGCKRLPAPRHQLSQMPPECAVSPVMRQAAVSARAATGI